MVSIGQKLLCLKPGIDEKWRCSGNFEERVKESIYKISAGMTAFGDDENDYEVLKYCGRGVAVGNAIPMIRDIADEIVESNNNDGVAKYLEGEFGL